MKCMDMLKTVVTSLVFGVTMSVSATTLTVVDQNGDPVVNAVVSIAVATNEVVKTDDVAVMDQVARQFVPRVLVINQGQQVTFPNSDDVRHHVYSFSAIKPFEIKLYKDSEETPIIYEKPGVGVLGCNIHDNMVGYIYVTDNEVAKVTDIQGQVSFDQTLPSQVTVWHADLSLKQTDRVVVPIDSSKENIEVSLTLIKKPKKSSTFGSRKFGQKG